MHRIYTEDTNRTGIMRTLDEVLDAYTLIPSVGRYKGKNESSLIVEIIGQSDELVAILAERIRALNAQDSVLVQRVHASNVLHFDMFQTELETTNV
jgi:hypothetical protein